MAEILLVRHAQSYANLRDFTAFGNIDSPLTDKGIQQAQRLGDIFSEQYDIMTGQHKVPVAPSEYKRAQQTAEVAHEFSEKRGYVPLQATVTKVEI
jgi:broad specificity phosphatase PhoE